MATLIQAKQLTSELIKDGCRYLKLDHYSIRLIFTPYIQPVYGIPQNVIVLDDDTFVVGEDFLSRLCDKGFTLLKTEIYAHLRFIANRRSVGKTLSWECEIRDAMAYATALLLLKGNQLPCPPMLSPEIFFGEAVNILSSEFNLHGNMFKMPTMPCNGASFYKIRLEEKDRLNFISKYHRSVALTGVAPLKGEVGAISNPFENVYDAINYLREIERQAYAKDKLMNDIAEMPYFYDVNQGHFRISWASPYVAHQRNNYPKHSFVMSEMAPLDLNHVDDFYFCLKPNLYKHKFLYRGQSDYYPGKPCVPNMFRDPEHNAASYYLDFLIFSQELQLLIQSHPIVQLLEQGIELLHDKFKIRMHYTGLAQHYYNKSTFLDFTSDLDVMKFFATTDYDSINDKYIPNEDESKIGVIYYYELKFPEAFQQHYGYAMKNIGKQVFLRSGLQSGFLLEMEKGVDLKQNVPEVKAVYFKHHADISHKIFSESNNGEVYFQEDLLQQAWLNRFKERFMHRVVSIQTVRFNVNLNEGETEDSIIAKLKDRNISVDDYALCFTDEELDAFYANIEEWWYNFCSDIHFGDTEDAIYRQAMREIIHDSKYSWAFKKNNGNICKSK